MNKSIQRICVSTSPYIQEEKTEAKYAGIGTVLIKENKWAFGRPLEKVSMTTRTYNTSNNYGKRETHIYKNTYKKKFP